MGSRNNGDPAGCLNSTAGIISAIATLIAAIAGLIIAFSGGKNPPPQHLEPLTGSHCCDLGGFRRCPLAVDLPLRAPCFCPSQGGGYVCK